MRKKDSAINRKNTQTDIHIIIAAIVLLISIAVIIYPPVTQSINSRHLSDAEAEYEDSVNKYSTDSIQKMLDKADAYNEKLAAMQNPLTDSEKENGYDDLLNVKGDVIGYLDIPSISVSIPIYHYTDSSSMQNGAGHMVGTSLPVGGKSTHAVLSAHSGIPDKRLFTDLDKVQIGDTFTITVLSRKLKYQVDQIETVLPNDDTYIHIEDGKDLVTLITCTPQGINTHRLLARGHRISTSWA